MAVLSPVTLQLMVALSTMQNSLTVNGSTFTSNSATYGGDGGAIYNYVGTLKVNNSTFTSNTANSNGGAIYNNAGTLNVSFCRIVGNTPYDIYSYGSSM